MRGPAAAWSGAMRAVAKPLLRRPRRRSAPGVGGGGGDRGRGARGGRRRRGGGAAHRLHATGADGWTGDRRDSGRGVGGPPRRCPTRWSGSRPTPTTPIRSSSTGACGRRCVRFSGSTSRRGGSSASSPTFASTALGVSGRSLTMCGSASPSPRARPGCSSPSFEAGEPGDPLLPPPADGTLVPPPLEQGQMCARGCDANVLFHGPASVEASSGPRSARSLREARHRGRASSGFCATRRPSGSDGPGIATRSSSATAGDARCSRARPVQACRTTT